MQYILKPLAEKIFRAPRYCPEIKWSDKSWTHNVFRCWEWMAGRKIGIRAEMTSTCAEGRVVYACHSWESVFALTEQFIRQWLSGFHLIHIEVYVPALNIGGQIPSLRIPAMFAIAHDADDTSVAGTTSPRTVTHTATGSSPLIVLAGASLGSSSGVQPTFTAASYNSVAATKAVSKQQTGGFFATKSEVSIWLLGSCATGSNTASMTATLGSTPGIAMSCTSYSGAQSGSTADATGSVGATTAGDKTFLVTTIADNCWVYAIGVTFSQTPTSLTADQTSRGTLSGIAGGGFDTAIMCAEDNNAAKTPAGAVTMGMNGAGTNFDGTAIAGASFAPAAVVVVSAPTDGVLPTLYGGVSTDEGAFSI